MVLESNPEQFADPESLQRLPEEEIAWSQLLKDPAFQGAIAAAVPPDDARGPFQELFQALRGAGFPVCRVKPMLRQWLRPLAVDGYAAEIGGDRFLVYRFSDQKEAARYAGERHHCVPAGTFVLRSDPLDQYQVYSEQTVERPVQDVAWSKLITDPVFSAALGKAG